MQMFFASDGMALSAVVSASLVFAFAATPYVRIISCKLGILDVPRDARRMHKKPVPLAGGAAMMISFLLTVIIFFSMNKSRLSWQTIFLLFACALCGACGLTDDIFALKPLSKLTFQFILAFFSAVFVCKMESFVIFGKVFSLGDLSVPITIFWIMLIMNAVNLTDGMDGLAPGICAVIAFAISIISFLSGELSFSICACAVCGACLGFLCHNASPASVFMGETGSAFLGLALSVMILPWYGIDNEEPLSTALLLFLLPISETVSSFFRRILRGKSPFSPDKKHIHHLLYEKGLSVTQVCLILYLFTAVCAVCAVIHAQYRAVAAVSFVAATIFINTMLLNKRQKTDKKEGGPL